MRMSAFTELQTIILTVLEDGQWHQLAEIKETIEKTNRELLSTKSYVGVVLTTLKKRGVIKAEKGGKYCLISNQEKEKEKHMEEINKKVRDEMIEKWREFYRSEFNDIASFEMSEDEFIEGKLRHALNKKIENMLTTEL